MTDEISRKAAEQIALEELKPTVKSRVLARNDVMQKRAVAGFEDQGKQLIRGPATHIILPVDVFEVERELNRLRARLTALEG